MRISDWSSDVCSSDLCAKSLFSANGGGHRSNVGIMGQKHQPRNDPLFLFAEVHCHDIGAVFIRRSVVFGSLMRLRLFARALHLKLKGKINGWIDKRQIGRAHVGTPVTHATLVCSCLLAKKTNN